ncbi:MAG TPA: hypothetical protein ENG70_02150 [Candidatus Cloacimonetes bacterium]|nr:hypothetical protein [Candidatus Cloacimonadota bacterium]HEX37647.1 hypothetical protein [Candidatus Cloacimonadota bacterium]
MNEKKRIIELLSDGKITAKQAEQLLSALSTKKEPSSQKKGKFFVIELIEQESEKNIIHLRMPVSLIKAGLKFIPKHAQIQAELKGSSFDISSINWDDILTQASDGEVGDVLYIEINSDEEKPLVLHVYIE